MSVRPSVRVTIPVCLYVCVPVSLCDLCTCARLRGGYLCRRMHEMERDALSRAQLRGETGNSDRWIVPLSYRRRRIDRPKYQGRATYNVLEFVRPSRGPTDRRSTLSPRCIHNDCGPRSY